MSIILQTKPSGNEVVYSVRNQELAYMDVWNECDTKCAYNSGRVSSMQHSSWYMYRPRWYMLGL
jgi:hypothetical protein